MDNAQLQEHRKRILLPWQVQQNSTVWAPWGKTGWSAVVVKTPQRKWAKGMRVKPHNGKENGKGKVPMDRLIKRDPELKGKDRPDFTPEEIFAPLQEIAEKVETLAEQPVVVPEEEDDGHVEWAHARDMGTHRETDRQRQARLHPPGRKPEEEMTPKEIKARDKRMDKILDLTGDDATDEDW
jgi:hypothetical protein